MAHCPREKQILVNDLVDLVNWCKCLMVENWYCYQIVDCLVQEGNISIYSALVPWCPVTGLYHSSYTVWSLRFERFVINKAGSIPLTLYHSEPLVNGSFQSAKKQNSL